MAARYAERERIRKGFRRMTLVDIPENPVPSGAEIGFIETADGVKIRYARWSLPEGVRRRGTVTILQGRAEFIEKYFEVVQDLRKRGFAVITFDWRGQGGSSRSLKNAIKGHVSSFSQYREDLQTVLKKVALAEYPGPHFALAHSTGAAVLLSDTARLRTMIDRAVLTAPLTGLLDGGKRERWAFRAACLLKWSGLGRMFIPGGNAKLYVDFDENVQTSDRRRYERALAVLDQEPALGIGSPTIGWLHAAGRCLKTFRHRRFGPSVALPVLVIAAGSDRIVSTPATEDLASRTKAAGYLEIPGAQHELMMETDPVRNQFWAAFDAFIPGREFDETLSG